MGSWSRYILGRGTHDYTVETRCAFSAYIQMGPVHLSSQKKTTIHMKYDHVIVKAGAHYGSLLVCKLNSRVGWY